MPVGGVDHHAWRFVDNHYGIVFITNIERNILCYRCSGLPFRAVPRNLDRDQFSRAQLVVHLHLLAIDKDGTGLDAVLHPVTADFRKPIGQEFIDPDGLLTGVDEDFLGFDVVYWVF